MNKPLIDSNLENAFSHFEKANALSELAALALSESLYNESFMLYERATLLDSDFVEAYYNWGIALYDYANLINSRNAFLASIEKYKKAIAINPNDASFYNNWGVSLMGIASMSGNNSEILKEAIKQFYHSEYIAEGSGAFNLACSYSLLKDAENGFKWLEKALDSNWESWLNNCREAVDDDFTCLEAYDAERLYALLEKHESSFK